jgi:hypothetical protein
MREYTGLLALDPGKTTGWAIFDAKGRMVDMGQANMKQIEDLDDKIKELKLSHIVYEDFKLFRHRATRQVGSRFEASQVIGKAETWAYKNDCEIVKQDPNIKSIAQKWSQVVPPSDHTKSHEIDAYNHGYYYLVKRGLRKSRLEELNVKND